MIYKDLQRLEFVYLIWVCRTGLVEADPSLYPYG